MGSKGSPGTKLLSISGDCSRPGIFEVPFGIKLREVLDLCGGAEAYAVQVGGPSGQMVGRDAFDRTICYDDLATGGSLMVFNEKRDVLQIASRFLDFFIEESCGYCTPCRVGNVLLKERVDRILDGKGEAADLAYLQDLGTTVKFASRCGLGQTSANPVLSTLKNFRPAYEKRLVSPAALRPSFDLRAALGDASAIAGRGSSHFQL
jgi:[NiFe] hydrogenase diaphorase moiety large subunit